MKRALGLIVIVAACVVGFLTVRGAMPFLPVFGTSMEPVLHAGNLITISPVSASEVKEGDIIVFNVASMIQDHYNYPPIVAHRVNNVYNEEGRITFRTKGDNTGEDPFAVRPQDLRGIVGDQIPYLGWPLLFLQSQQGSIFAIIGLALLALFLYSGELDTGRRKLQRGVFAPVIQESHRTSRMLAQKIETTEEKMNTTERALEKFATAIEAYAQHLSSHTSAIQGLSEASHELKRSSAQQNQVLMHLMETMGQAKPAEETVSRAEQVVHELEKRTPEVEKVQLPPGCTISRKALLKRIRETGLDKT